MERPRKVGQTAANAGRSMEGIMRRQIFAMAIRAPVLPAEIATSASPFFTASTASHIEDLRRPARNAWLGLSPILTATSVCLMAETAARPLSAATSGFTRFSSPTNKKFMSGWRANVRMAPATITSGP
jgi:hypothetical protein